MGVHFGKFDTFMKYINEGRNIVTTHAMFQMFTKDTIARIKEKHYILILDEVANVVAPYNELSKDDLDILLSTWVDIDEKTGMLSWKSNSERPYHGTFDKVRNLIEMSCLAKYGNDLLVWLFPIESFNAFDEIYILTYMFEAQIQRCYYDYFGVEYEYLYVEGDSPNTFHFTREKGNDKSKYYNFKNLISIYPKKTDEKSIGNKMTDLSVTWYINAEKKHLEKLKEYKAAQIKPVSNSKKPVQEKRKRGRPRKDESVKLQNKENENGKKNKNKGPDSELMELNRSIYNFFHNICDVNSTKTIWTTFKDYKKYLSCDRYKKSFLEINSRATNEYQEANCIAYMVNRYMNVGIKNFLICNGVYIDEDGFALSEMLQFIWRSAIRNGKEIKIFIPSRRMRDLLIKWIDENTV
jgi:hypothetical protein